MATIAQQAGLIPAPKARGSSGALIGIASGVALALVGVIGRKLLVQSPTALAGSWDHALMAEHKIALRLFDKLARTRKRQSTKRAFLLTQLKHALGKHALAEENAVYPAMRDAGMLAEADTLNREHGYVKQYLYDLARITDDAEAFKAKLSLFRSDIEKHMRSEEQRLFPRLKALLSAEQSKTLTVQINKEGLKLA